MDNILLITEDENVAESILSKLVLLRESDSIAVCDYKTGIKALENSCVSIVILHEKQDNEQTLNYINAIKSDNYEIILLVNKYNSEFILKAYDSGINDYYSVHSEPYEMLIKTVNCFKFRTLKIKRAHDFVLLKQLGAVNEETGFYKYKYCKEILEDFIKDPKIKNGMFIVMSVDEESKTRFSGDKLSKAIKQSVRGDDIVFVVNGGKFYLMLPNIEKTGAFAVVNKVQDILGDKIIIHAGISKIANKSYERLEKETFAAFSEACQTNETAVFLEEKVKGVDEWLDDEEEKRNFKLFQNSYNHKLENVITPVFYRLQKTYEEKLFNTKIEQYSDELQSVFRLKHEKCESCLKIIYPGFTKLFISISYEGLESPENVEFSIDLKDVTQSRISKIVEGYIKEFKKFVKE